MKPPAGARHLTDDRIVMIEPRTRAVVVILEARVFIT